MQLAHSTPTPRNWHRCAVMANPDGQQVVITECSEKVKVTSRSGNVVHVATKKPHGNFHDTIAGLGEMGYILVSYTGKWTGK